MGTMAWVGMGLRQLSRAVFPVGSLAECEVNCARLFVFGLEVLADFQVYEGITPATIVMVILY